MLKGRIALVTGASRGIGFSIASALAANRATVIMVAKDEERLSKAAAVLRAHGADVKFYAADLTNDNDINKLADFVKNMFGKLNILINNAGYAARARFTQETIEDLDMMYKVNLRAPFVLTQKLLPLMINETDSRIINMSSVAGKWGISELAGYSAMKFEVIGFTEALAREFGVLTDMKVYAVCPPGVKTDTWEKLYPGQRAGLEPDDVSSAVLKLCRPDATEATGSSILIQKERTDAETTEETHETTDTKDKEKPNSSTAK